MHLGCIYTSLFRSSSVQKFRKIVLVKDIIDHSLNVSRIWITNNQIIGIKTCFLHFNFLHLILLYQLYLFCSFSVKRNKKNNLIIAKNLGIPRATKCRNKEHLMQC